MNLHATDRFISAASAGSDWRDAARHVLEALQRERKPDDGMNVGFLYITDTLADDAPHILDLMKSITGVTQWVGSVGLGICASGEEYFDQPAISVLLGKFGADEVALIPPVDADLTPARDGLKDWLAQRMPMLGLVHGDPMIDADPAQVLSGLAQLTGAFLSGGMSSSRGGHLQIAGEVAEGSVSGMLFSENVAVSTALSQGCVPLGPVHTITRCEGHVVMELDHKRAFDVFLADLKERAGGDTLSGAPPETSLTLQKSLTGAVPGIEDLQHLFRGEVHVAFPVTGSDQRDYLVRNAIGIDPEEGHLAIAHEVAPRDAMMFVQRDDAAMQADLIRTLNDLKKRVIRERGDYAPKGALYISCLSRAMADFGQDGAGVGGEMNLVRDILGDIPLAGFYANGEISNHRLYGYTALVILFH